MIMFLNNEILFFKKDEINNNNNNKLKYLKYNTIKLGYLFIIFYIKILRKFNFFFL